MAALLYETNVNVRPFFSFNRKVCRQKAPHKAFPCKKTLEDELGRHLQLPCAGGAIRTAKLAEYLAKIVVQDLIADTRRIISWIVEVGVIEHAISLQAEFDADVFPDSHPFGHTHIQVHK